MIPDNDYKDPKSLWRNSTPYEYIINIKGNLMTTIKTLIKNNTYGRNSTINPGLINFKTKNEDTLVVIINTNTELSTELTLEFKAGPALDDLMDKLMIVYHDINKAKPFNLKF